MKGKASWLVSLASPVSRRHSAMNICVAVLT
jgi:hypothetical protein